MTVGKGAWIAAAVAVVSAGLVGIRSAESFDCRRNLCVQKVQKVQVVQKVQAVELVPANVFYFVGAPIRQAAIVQQQMHTDPLWEEFQQFQKFKAFSAQADAKAGTAPPPTAGSVGPEPRESKGSVLAATCMRCHGGEDPQGGLDLSLPLTSALKGEIAKQVWLGKMPPEKPLNNEQAAKLFDELFKGESE